MLVGMAKRTNKRALHQARQNVVPITKLPRHVERLPVAHVIAWIAEATRLTVEQVLTRPGLVREQLLAALKRERRAARKRRMAL